MNQADLAYRAIVKLKKLRVSNDIEAAHGDADDVLRELLIELGYAEVVEEYDQIEKWFA